MGELDLLGDLGGLSLGGAPAAPLGGGVMFGAPPPAPAGGIGALGGLGALGGGLDLFGGISGVGGSGFYTAPATVSGRDLFRGWGAQ